MNALRMESERKPRVTAELLNIARDSEAIGRLRYRVFVEQLGWVPGDQEQLLELDDFDETAFHVGVRNGQELSGYMRVLFEGNPAGLLAQREPFKSMLPVTHPVPGSIELSRFCVDPKFQGRELSAQISAALFAEVYNFCVRANKEWVYALADDNNAQGFNSKQFFSGLFPFHEVGQPKQLKPGVNTHLLVLRVSEVRDSIPARKFLGIS